VAKNIQQLSKENHIKFPQLILEQLILLNKKFFNTFHLEKYNNNYEDVLVDYLSLLLSSRDTFGRFCLANNRIYKSDAYLFIPYLIENKLLVFTNRENDSDKYLMFEVPKGTIITDLYISSLIKTKCKTIDLESKLHDLN